MTSEITGACKKITTTIILLGSFSTHHLSQPSIIQPLDWAVFFFFKVYIYPHLKYLLPVSQ